MFSFGMAKPFISIEEKIVWQSPGHISMFCGFVLLTKGGLRMEESLIRYGMGTEFCFGGVWRLLYV